ncbi:MAG: hypothetical protein ABSF69_19315 [Polyangiaceae bacterium]
MRDVPEVLQALEDPGEGVDGIQVAQEKGERCTGAREGHGKVTDVDRHDELRDAVAVGRLAGQVGKLVDREGLGREVGVVEPYLHQAVTGFDKRMDWLRAHLDRSKSTVLVLRADSPPATLWMPFKLRDWAPARWRVLSFRAGLMTAIRRGPRTLEITSRDHPLFPTGPFDLFRSTDALHSGDVVEVPGMRATLLQVDDQQAPKQVRLDFDVDLDDSSVRPSPKGNPALRKWLFRRSTLASNWCNNPARCASSPERVTHR